MDYRNKNFDDYDNYYELDIHNFEELRVELETTIFKNVFVENTSVHFFGNSNNYNPFDTLPGITNFRKKLKLPTETKFMVNCIKQHDSTKPHIDNSDNPWAILFPIRNTKNTRLEYYTSTTKPKLVSYINETGQTVTVWDVDKENLILTDSLELSRPTIINNQRIHNAINPVNSVRWTVALVCAGLGWDPLLAKDYFYKQNN